MNDTTVSVESALVEFNLCSLAGVASAMTSGVQSSSDQQQQQSQQQLQSQLQLQLQQSEYSEEWVGLQCSAWRFSKDPTEPVMVATPAGVSALADQGKHQYSSYTSADALAVFLLHLGLGELYQDLIIDSAWT